MKRKLFNACAALSLLAALLLATGYIVRTDLTAHYSGGGPPRTSFRDLQVGLQQGRVEAHVIALRPPPAATATAPRLRFSWSGWRIRFELPDVRRSLWDFDAHPLPLKAPLWVYLVAFPIWCLLLPSLILPGLWMLRWRREHRDTQGFPVLPQTQPA